MGGTFGRRVARPVTNRHVAASLSIPSGASAHRTCFQCHGPQTETGGRNIGSCSTCHQPGRLVRTSENAKAYGVNFSHQEHLSRGKTNCASCHNVLAGGARATGDLAGGIDAFCTGRKGELCCVS
ncbi:MAG: cytochrome c3 family protein [Chloracidobacterium sp.]|nr:cytochrome c3 family protein [Chloracidobacterium sp.]